MTRTFLFVLWAGGGNVGPQLAVAHRLQSRGHRVHVLAPAALRERVLEAGAVFESYDEMPEHDEGDATRSLIRDFEPRTPVGAVAAVRDRLIGRMALPAARDVLDLLGRIEVDAVAYDYLLVGAGFAGEAAGVPAVPLFHHFPPLPAPGAPPYGMGWLPAKGLPGRMRDAFGYWAFERLLTRPLLEPLNGVRRELGLAPLTAMLDAYLGQERVLVLSSRALELPAPRPANVIYVGAQVDDPASTSPFQWTPPGDRPAVVASLSTTYMGQETLLERVVGALGQLPVTALVTTGPVSLNVDVPANVAVHDFVGHASVLPQADVVVTHAGHGTVAAALANGVPLVCLPIARDQPDVAARVVHAGAGIRLSPRSSSRAIAAAVQRVLGDDRYRAAAREIQAAMSQDTAADKAVAGLEAAAQHVRPGAALA